MANSNVAALYPEFWATAFDEADLGMYNLQNQISRKYEGQVAKAGDTVNVPLVPDLADADDWTPGDAITSENVTQETVTLVLDKSKKKTITLTGTELSLSPYDLIANYGVPMAEKILEAVNTEIYKAALGSTYFINDAGDAVTEDDIVDLKTALDNNKIGKAGRVLVLSSDDVGALLKTDAFQYANYSGDAGKAMSEGELIKKFGFKIVENNIIEDYTPADVAGAINNVAGYSAGDETIIVDALNDDAALVRMGDLFAIAGTATKYSVRSTTLTTGDTTGITLSQSMVGNTTRGLSADEDNDDVVTISPTRSGLAFVPSAMAFASRPYANLPSGAGVQSTVMFYQGLPIRVSVWHDGKLGVSVQFDVLFGVSLVKEKRMIRLIA